MVDEWIVGEFFFSLRKEIDTEWVFIDGSYIRCHQHASGARLGFDRAIGQSHGGRTTKIHLCCDADGYPLDFKVTGGEVHDSQVAPKLIERFLTKFLNNNYIEVNKCTYRPIISVFCADP